MSRYKIEEVEATLVVIHQVLQRCKKSQLKFQMGTSQYTRLYNRIQSLITAKTLILGKGKYTKQELQAALIPLISIANKCKKGQEKHEENTSVYIRFQKMIQAMEVAIHYIEMELSSQNDKGDV